MPCHAMAQILTMIYQHALAQCRQSTMPPMLRPGSIIYINLGTWMPNGGSHFRSALQREEPSPCHTSDEEWVQAAKEAWPRPRILTLYTIRAWHTLVVRSQVATALRSHRLIPRILVEHYPVIFDHLASFLAVSAHDRAPRNAPWRKTLLREGFQRSLRRHPAQATEASSSSQSRTERPAVLHNLLTDGAEIQLCQCPRGCVATAETGEAYCLQCYAQAGADFYTPPGKKYPPGVAPLEQPPCECPNPCCNPITTADARRASGEILNSADPTATTSTLGSPIMQQAAASLPQLLTERAAPGHGGASAALEQRRLRAWCLSQTPKVYKVTMTHGSWPWRELLRGMHPSAFGEAIQRDGTIMEFNFRLLSQNRDHNWRKHDSGERHVFEMIMRNGDVWHLHFHKRGTCDKLRRWTLPDIFYERQCSLAATMVQPPQ